VETVKGYASHERATFEAVTAARSAATTATSVNDKVQAENMLTGALGRLFALSEAYPDLKANTNFLELQRELSDIENKLAAARRFFNNAVSEFNAIRRQFPTVLFAAMVGFGSDKPFFDVGETDRAAMTAAPPSVSFQA
jgi:LemA protein